MGYRPRLLPPYRDWLLSRTADGKDFTLRGLQAALALRGDKVDYNPDLIPIAQVFAKLNHLMRKAAQRTIETT